MPKRSSPVPVWVWFVIGGTVVVGTIMAGVIVAAGVYLFASKPTGNESATVYVTVPQTGRPEIPSNEPPPTPSTPPTAKIASGSTTKPTEKLVDPPRMVADKNAERLKKIDQESLAAIRKGDKKAGMSRYLEVAKEYFKKTEADCTPDESLALSIIYIRIVAVTGKDLGEAAVKTYLNAITIHSRKGGIAKNNFDKWYQDLLLETDIAWVYSR